MRAWALHCCHPNANEMNGETFIEALSWQTLEVEMLLIVEVHLDEKYKEDEVILRQSCIFC